MQLNSEEIRKRAIAESEAAADSRALYEVKMKYLGRAGEVTALLKGMKQVPAEERPAFGKQVNDLRVELEAAFEAQEEKVRAKELLPFPYHAEY